MKNTIVASVYGQDGLLTDTFLFSRDHTAAEIEQQAVKLAMTLGHSPSSVSQSEHEVIVKDTAGGRMSDDLTPGVRQFLEDIRATGMQIDVQGSYVDAGTQYTYTHGAVLIGPESKFLSFSLGEPPLSNMNTGQTVGARSAYRKRDDYPHEYVSSTRQGGCDVCGYGPGAIFHNSHEIERHRRQETAP